MRPPSIQLLHLTGQAARSRRVAKSLIHSRTFKSTSSHYVLINYFAKSGFRLPLPYEPKTPVKTAVSVSFDQFTLPNANGFFFEDAKKRPSLPPLPSEKSGHLIQATIGLLEYVARLEPASLTREVSSRSSPQGQHWRFRMQSHERREVEGRKHNSGLLPFSLFITEIPSCPPDLDIDVVSIRLKGDILVPEYRTEIQAGNQTVPSNTDEINQLVSHVVDTVVEWAVALQSPPSNPVSLCRKLAFIAARVIAEKFDYMKLRKVDVALKTKISGTFANSSMDLALTDRSPVGKLHDHRVFIALGSNMGNRFEMIERACREMDNEGVHVVATSTLWETKAMYVEDQENFINGVCEVRVSRRNRDYATLLKTLQSLENKMGRVKTMVNGPRCIDLDILLCGNQSFHNSDIPLTIPHKSILERQFVLRPLCELIPRFSLPSTMPAGTFESHLRNLIELSESKIQQREAVEGAKSSVPAMSPQVPLCPSLPPLAPILPNRKTHIMSILNVTPDSFSDGGLHTSTDLPSLEKTISAHLAAGVTLIDIGGQSSRPGAEPISSEEEISRILPTIELVKGMKARNVENFTSSGFVGNVKQKYSFTPTKTAEEASDLSAEEASTASVTGPTNTYRRDLAAISVDTYRADVAEAAIKAGAHIINDISAGQIDSKMLPTIAQLGCTYVLMHMRGTPETMTSKENTSYDGDIIETIGNELLGRVNAAQKAGIRRWRMILDPGIGFAKTADQNLEILRRFKELRNFEGLRGMPWLVGVSRKGFIGKITGVREASERSWGTAAAVAAAVQGGADIVRVHDVEEMVKVVRMADAIWRV